ncbi:MAG: VWA domain-containing protein [Acidobacteria bacterium]|nr:VWA domain-containing protein [Acidobacteriota bacterium]
MTCAKSIKIASVWLLLFCVIAFSALAQEQQSPTPPDPDAPIKLGSTLVSVPVIVSDRSGRYVSGLKAEQFTLYRDGNRQPLAFFSAEEETLNVALLIDTSKSTREVLDQIKDHAQDFLKQLRPQDKAMVVSFDYQVHILTRLTADRKELERAIKRAEIGEYLGTTLRDAVYEVIEHHFKTIKGRKAIILLTDGKDHGSQVANEDLLETAAESDAMIYSIFYTTNFPTFNRGGERLPRRDRMEPFPPFGRGGRRRFPQMNGQVLPQSRAQQFPDRGQRRERQERQNEQAVEFLERLSNLSAGRFYRSEVGDLNKNFALIADELRHQYRLGFYPDGEKREGSVHRLRVEVSQVDAVVRARRTYTD